MTKKGTDKKPTKPKTERSLSTKTQNTTMLRKFSKVELAMLHLSKFGAPSGEKYYAAKAQTQEGIAHTLSRSRAQISKLLKDMADKGLVENIPSKQRGSHREKHTYYLTPKGMTAADKLIKYMDDKNLKMSDVMYTVPEIKDPNPTLHTQEGRKHIESAVVALDRGMKAYAVKKLANAIDKLSDDLEPKK